MVARLKEALGCRFGFHRYGEWGWLKSALPGGQPRQYRFCLDCHKKQGPLVSSEERRYYESCRDRRGGLTTTDLKERD